MPAAKYIKLIAEAKKLIPRFYREYKGASDWWYPVTIDGKVFELNFTTHDPEGTGSFPKKKQDKVKIVAYPNGIDGKFFGLGYFQGMRQTNQNPKRCWKGYAPVRGMKPYSKGSCRKVRGNPAARTKTWKLGEYGGNIKANVNQSGTAVQIIHSDKPLIAGAYGRLFRWPLDRNELEMHLTDFTTSYYASKIIEWVDSVIKGTSMNPVPAGYHIMPDGRVMADSAHSVSMNPRGIDPNLAYKKEYGWTFVDFLKKRLIPDLRESGMDATANDYQRGISLYRDKKGVLPITSSMNYLKYLRETLIPDLKASGSDSTAADFERMYKMVLYTIDRHPKSRGR